MHSEGQRGELRVAGQKDGQWGSEEYSKPVPLFFLRCSCLHLLHRVVGSARPGAGSACQGLGLPRVVLL